MLRPCHLFSLAAISHDKNCSRNVSGLATSEEKNTEAVTDLSSISMPAFWQACLMIAWVFCRGVLIEVWNTNLSFLPSFARMPSGPLRHPASSKIWFALSTLNSHFVLVETNCFGL